MPNTPTPALSVVVPVRDEPLNAIYKIYKEIEAEGWEALIIDDGSEVPIPFAKQRTVPSRGYGAAIKTGVQLARAELVATMDGDGQHTVADLKRVMAFFDYFDVDMVVGDRRLKEPTQLRLWGRKVLNWTATCFARRWIPDLNSGMRVFRKKIALGYGPILCDGFSYTTTLTLSMLADNYKVDWLPIKVGRRVAGKTHVRLFRDGWITLQSILWIGLALRTRKLRETWRAFIHG